MCIVNKQTYTMKNLLFQLTDALNSFDPYYVMSDSSKVFNEGNKLERKLLKALEACTPSELADVYNNLSEGTKGIKSLLISYILENMEVAKEVSSKSTIFSTAWTYIKDGLVSTMSEALKLAWKRFKLISKLKTGIASFSFKKATGVIREAIGTLRNGDFDYKPKTPGAKINLQIVKYFDIQANAFRSCRIDRLIEVAA